MVGKKIRGIIVGPLALLALIGAGCTVTTDSDDTSVVVEPDTAVVADAPEGCVSKNSLVVTSSAAGTEKPEAANSYAIQWEGSEHSMQLVFADYAVDPLDIYGNIEGENMLAVVYASSADNETPTDVGTYTKASDAEMVAGQLNISTAELAGGVFDDTATVELTYVGDDYVCGTITADDTYSSINGDFIAQYELRSY